MFTPFLNTSFRLPGLLDADWEQLRLALLRRSLLMLLPLVSLYVFLTALLGHSVLPSLAGLGFACLVLVMLQHRPDARRVLTWGLGLAMLALTALSMLEWRGPAPAPGLIIVSLLGTLGLMLDGWRFGAALFFGSLVLHGVALGRLEPGDESGFLAVATLAGAGVGLFVSSLGWFFALTQGQAELREANLQLQRQAEDRQVLSLGLFQELRQAQADMQAALGAEGPVRWDQAYAQAEVMQARATKIRGLRNSWEEPPAKPAAATDFGRSVMLAILWVSVLLALLGFKIFLLTGHARSWHSVVALAALGFGLYTLRNGRPVPAWLAWMVVLLGPALLTAGQIIQGGHGLDASANFWCLVILHAGLLLHWRMAVGLALAGTALISATLAAGPGGAAQWQLGLTLSLAFGMVIAICLQSVLWQQNVVQLLDEGHRRLALSLVQRRRLLGTLFHDVANPLGALLGLCEQGRAGMEAPGDADRARRLVRRLRELLQGSEAWLLDDGSGAGPSLTPLELEPLLAGMADLFKERLEAKRLSLNLEVQPGTQALAHAAVLRDSVVGNLMSNAIKFSRPGSALELEALRQGDEACVELRDRGPGLEAELAESLAGGQDLPSRRGTAGERGQGLGLALAKEHLQRMGGRLELMAREGGGTVARIWLKAV